MPAAARKGRGEAPVEKGSTSSCCSTTAPPRVTSSRWTARHSLSPSRLEKVRVSRGEVPVAHGLAGVEGPGQRPCRAGQQHRPAGDGPRAGPAPVPPVTPSAAPAAPRPAPPGAARRAPPPPALPTRPPRPSESPRPAPRFPHASSATSRFAVVCGNYGILCALCPGTRHGP